MTTQFPDWAKPGNAVLSVTYRYGTRGFRRGTIARLTNTRIVVTFGGTTETQFVQERNGRWEEYGRRGEAWHNAAQLIDADSPEAAEMYADAERAVILQDARAAVERFTRNPSVETAQVATAALDNYIASVIEQEEK